MTPEWHDSIRRSDSRKTAIRTHRLVTEDASTAIAPQPSVSYSQSNGLSQACALMDYVTSDANSAKRGRMAVVADLTLDRTVLQDVIKIKLLSAFAANLFSRIFEKRTG